MARKKVKVKEEPKKRLVIGKPMRRLEEGLIFLNRRCERCFVKKYNYDDATFTVECLEHIKRKWSRTQTTVVTETRTYTVDGRPIPRNAKLNLVGKPQPSYDHLFVGEPAEPEIEITADQLDKLVQSTLPYYIKDKLLAERNAEETHDPVNHPKHYTAHPSGVECIEITRHMSFNLGNAMKYIWRADEKGKDIEDLEKAIWYLNDEINKRKGAKTE